MESTGNEVRVEVKSTPDVVTARREARALARTVGFEGNDLTLIAAAISEVGRNIVEFAREGEILLDCIQDGSRRGIQIVARDQGPGIANLAKAMQYGYSTRHRVGAGLPGAKWLMDEFEIQSYIGKGTTITMKKWAEQSSQAQ